MLDDTVVISLVGDHCNDSVLASTAGPPFPTESLLRIHVMQPRFSLCDPAMEESLHDMPLSRDFAGLSDWDDLPPDQSITALGFLHILERHTLCRADDGNACPFVGGPGA